MGCNTGLVNVRARRIVSKRQRPVATVQPREDRTTATIAAYMRAMQRKQPCPASEMPLGSPEKAATAFLPARQG